MVLVVVVGGLGGCELFVAAAVGNGPKLAQTKQVVTSKC